MLGVVLEGAPRVEGVAVAASEEGGLRSWLPLGRQLFGGVLSGAGAPRGHSRLRRRRRAARSRRRTLRQRGLGTRGRCVGLRLRGSSFCLEKVVELRLFLLSLERLRTPIFLGFISIVHSSGASCEVSALHYAAGSGCVDLVEALLDARAALNSRDSRGMATGAD